MLQTFKKLRNIDNLVIVEDEKMLSPQNQWLVARDKISPEIKAQMKKTVIVEKKLIKKLNKIFQKT